MSVVANLSFWTVMADLGFCTLVADFGFRHWWPILDLDTGGRFWILDFGH